MHLHPPGPPDGEPPALSPLKPDQDSSVPPDGGCPRPGQGEGRRPQTDPIGEPREPGGGWDLRAPREALLGLLGLYPAGRLVPMHVLRRVVPQTGRLRTALFFLEQVGRVSLLSAQGPVRDPQTAVRLGGRWVYYVLDQRGPRAQLMLRPRPLRAPGRPRGDCWAHHRTRRSRAGRLSVHLGAPPWTFALHGCR